MKLDTTLFADIADKLELESPAIIEKDYWAVQLLKIIMSLKFDDRTLCFAGGTCLAKAHFSTYRMSEDIDIKIFPENHILGSTKGHQIKKRKEFKEKIKNSIKENEYFNIIPNSDTSKDSGAYRSFQISYPKLYDFNALRPELKLEFTEKTVQHIEPIEKSISSIYAEELQLNADIRKIACDKLELIMIEKLISLLRRVAEVTRGYNNNEDETLIRHVYDLHLIFTKNFDKKLAKSLFQKIIEEDKKQFGNRHKEFESNPRKELLYGLKELHNNNIYKERYFKYLQPFVFNKNSPNWDDAIKSVKELSNFII